MVREDIADGPALLAILDQVGLLGGGVSRVHKQHMQSECGRLASVPEISAGELTAAFYAICCCHRRKVAFLLMKRNSACHTIDRQLDTCFGIAAAAAIPISAVHECLWHV